MNDVKVYRVREHATPARPDPLLCPRNRTGTSLHRCELCALPGHSRSNGNEFITSWLSKRRCMPSEL